MSKELKRFKKKARIVRKQIQKICVQFLLPCSLVVFIYTEQPNDKSIADVKSTTQVVA